MAAVPEEAEQRRLFAAARKAAKDSLVEIDIQKRFCDVVRSGLLMEELEHAFSFTQTNLDGPLECTGCLDKLSHRVSKHLELLRRCQETCQRRRLSHQTSCRENDSRRELGIPEALK